MKTLGAIILCSILAINSVNAQQPFQLLIPGYDDTIQSVCFCDGERQNGIDADNLYANILYQTFPNLHVDSIIYNYDATKFFHVKNEYGLDINIASSGFFASYEPPSSGNDTIRVSGYYGPYMTKSEFIFHSKQMPSLCLYGKVSGLHMLIPGKFGVYNSNYQFVTDTLFHDMTGDSKGAYRSTGEVRSTGDNKYVTVRSCGIGGIIDSIYTVGDFSDFEFINFPTAPITLSGKDSITINYYFKPVVEGTHPHYIVFHTTEGRYLVWSFRYSVFPPKSVASDAGGSNSFIIYPNPCRGMVSLYSNDSKQVISSIKLVNSIGTTVMSINGLDNQNSNNMSMDVSTLSRGIYYCFIYSNNVQSVEKIVVM
jgi:hypothetical protein